MGRIKKFKSPRPISLIAGGFFVGSALLGPPGAIEAAILGSTIISLRRKKKK